MSDSSAEMPSQLGLILKSAREEMSLSLEQVAHELHLRPAVVSAIEEENYDEFSSDVFLKGYFRTYCRLVNLHEARMMDVLEKQLFARNKKAEQVELLASKKIQSRQRKRMIITVLVFCVFSLLIAFVYQMSSQGFGISDTTNDNEHKELTTDVGATVQPEVTVSRTPSNLADESPQTELTDDSEPTPDISEEPFNLAIKEGLDEIPEEDIALDTSADPVRLDSADLSGNSSEGIAMLSSIKATFTGDCWFKVTDITGKNVIAGLKKTDDEVSFQGSAPFHVVIGDASKVSLFFEEKLVNLKPYTSRNGRAELTLKPSVSVNQG
tara:strand:+ start:48 stop:1019 length:972 start_codon:yes stop_codon:yes gene_type:complete